MHRERLLNLSTLRGSSSVPNPDASGHVAESSDGAPLPPIGGEETSADSLE